MIPWTAWSRTSSTTPNASIIEASSARTSATRSFGTTIIASTLASSSAAAASATRIRCEPSNPNGLVTTAIVSAPWLRALAATIGAAPDPVPPPRPAVTNTRSAPATACAILAASSSAARRPISGSPPEPRPPVMASPIRIFVAAVDPRSAWASVLQTTKLAARIPALTMRSTALLPPPPTPTTRIARDSGSPGAIGPRGDRDQEAQRQEDGKGDDDDGDGLARDRHRLSLRPLDQPPPRNPYRAPGSLVRGPASRSSDRTVPGAITGVGLRGPPKRRRPSRRSGRTSGLRARCRTSRGAAARRRRGRGCPSRPAAEGPRRGPGRRR